MHDTVNGTALAFEQVATGIFALEHGAAGGRNAVIIGQASALAVDGGGDAVEGEATARLIREQGHEPRRLVLTHGHGDHVSGAAPLAGGEVFAHTRCRAQMESRVPALAQRWGVSEEEAASRLPWPTTTFDQEIRLDLGGRTVRLVPTPGHSPDGISALVEDGGVLVCGDTVVTCIPPQVGDGNSRVLEASLLRLLDLGAQALIPGHGPVLVGGDQTSQWLRWQAGYLSRTRRQVRQQLIDGASPREAAATAGFEEMVGDRLEPQRHDAARLHAATALKIAEEEQVRLP